MSYVDRRGRVIWSLGADLTRRDASGFDTSVPSPAVSLTFPIPAVDGTTAQGELRAELHLNALLPDTITTGDRVLAVFDRRSGLALAPTPLPSSATRADEYDDEAGNPWLVARDTVAELPLLLVLAAPSAAYVAPFRSAARAGVVTLIVIGLAVVVLTLFLTARMTDRLRQLAGAAAQIRQGNLDRRVDVTSRDEVGVVAEAFNAMTARLRETLAELARRESLAAVGQFAASVSHEVRNALTPIRVDLQRAMLDTDPVVHSRLVERALRNTERLDAIVSNSLRLARTGNLERRSFSLLDMLNGAIRLSQREFVRRGHVVTLDEPSADTVTFSGNADALQQLFRNLLLNAAEADGDAVVAVRADAAHVAIAVSDNGVGVTDALIADGAPVMGTSKPEGTGLGLTIAGDIVKAHGGTMRFARGAPGTVVTVTLPRRPADPCPLLIPCR